MNTSLNGMQLATVAAAKIVTTAPSARSFDAAARCLDTIGDPIRLRILWWLERGERSVTELCGLLGMRQQAVTHHLNIMKITHLIAFRRRGSYNFYRLTEAGQEAMAAATLLLR